MSSNETFWVMLTAIASWALVIVTWRLIKSQIKLGKLQLDEQRRFANEQLDLSRSDLKVRLQVNYEEKFDSETFINERKKLATQLLAKTHHNEIQEPIMNFFESVGLLLRKKYLDPEMVWSGFSFYAIRWWCACKDYISEERQLQHNDGTIFNDFENLVDELYKIEIAQRNLTRAKIEPSRDDIASFLEAEKNL